MTYDVQTVIPAETDDEVTIVEVRTVNGAKHGGPVLTPIASGASRVKEEISDAVEVGMVCGDDLYAEIAKHDERNEPGGRNKRALRNMHYVEVAVTRYDGVQVANNAKRPLYKKSR